MTWAHTEQETPESESRLAPDGGIEFKIGILVEFHV
jgi:hypothetical protein